MKDPRFTDLANLLVKHSCDVQPGEHVLVEAHDIPAEFTVELIRTIAAAGGRPIVETRLGLVTRALLQIASEEQFTLIGDVEKHRMQQVQCYIGLRGSNNVTEQSDVPTERISIYEKLVWHPV